MKISKKKGFTLIELLVVVLIIGILSAIALPQYTKAVEKSRAAEGLIQGKALLEALKLYKLANGEVNYSLEGLDYEMPEGWSCQTTHCQQNTPNAAIKFEVSSYYSSYPSLWCLAKDKSIGKICESFGGSWVKQEKDRDYYYIQK